MVVREAGGLAAGVRFAPARQIKNPPRVWIFDLLFSVELLHRLIKFLVKVINGLGLIV